MVVVTTDSVPGKTIVKRVGEIEARSNFLVLNETKGAQQNLEKKAAEMGANAIIGFKIKKMGGHPTAYGTAVVVE
ncbi:MAG: heavy metal-binding domain-containing protein [Chloroflexota bacterium]